MINPLDFFKKKKAEPLPEPSLPAPIEEPAPLPEDLERFRMDRPAPAFREPPVPAPRFASQEFPSETPREEYRMSGDKIELILQKLDTIDARLKLLEEKMRR